MPRRPLSIRLAALASVAAIVQPGPGWAAQINGTTGRDVLVGTTLGDTITGGDDNDILRGDPATGDYTGVTIRRISLTAPNAKGLQLQANGASSEPSFSPDGEWVVFTSTAANLGPDANTKSDVFAKNLTTGEVILVSAAAPQNGVSAAGDFPSRRGIFSPDGRKVLFESFAGNLAGGGTATWDLFLKDVQAGGGGLVTLVSEKGGTPANGDSSQATFSPDGTKIAYTSTATNLGADANSRPDVFVKNLNNQVVDLVSANQAGVAADMTGSRQPAFSPDGTKVAFSSDATNLVGGDQNGVADIFVKTLAGGAVDLVSASAPFQGTETQGNGESSNPTFSPDGKSVAFLSSASNFVEDVNTLRDVFVKELGGDRKLTLQTSGKFGQGEIPSSTGDTKSYAFSEDWSRFAFVSNASDLGPYVPADAQGLDLAYTKNFITRSVAIASLAADGPAKAIGAPVTDVAISADGRQIAFVSAANNIVPDDTNGVADVFVVTLAQGSGAGDTISGGNGADLLSGGLGNDSLFGDAGDDTLAGGPGDDNIVGGTADGTGVGDIAVWPGPRRRYKVDPFSQGGNTFYTVTDMSPTGNEGIDFVSEVEKFRFTAAPGLLFDPSTPGGNNQPPVGEPVTLKTVSGVGNLVIPVVVSDPDGDALTVELGSTEPEAGSVEFLTEGGVVYDANAQDSKTVDQFTLKVSDPYGGVLQLPVTVAIGINLYGSNEVSDTITGGAGDDVIIGDGDPFSNVGGNDVLNGLGGDDVLDGGIGNDQLFGGDGSDILDGGVGIDVMTGGAGDDIYYVDNAKDKVVELPGEGLDSIETIVSYTLPANVENVAVVTTATTVQKGNALANMMTGGAGKDTLYGDKGNDTIIGAAGNDTIDGGAGADKLDGGAGIDVLSYATSTAAVSVDLKKTAFAGDTLVRNFENVTGSSRNDKLLGSDVANVLLGGNGNDTIEGRKGKDTLTGGAGKDVFVYRAITDSPVKTPDTITDLKTGDLIDFRAFDADAKKPGKQAFTYIGKKKFAKKAGQLRFAKGVLEAETTGDGKADFAVRLTKVTKLAKTALKLK